LNDFRSTFYKNRTTLKRLSNDFPAGLNDFPAGFHWEKPGSGLGSGIKGRKKKGPAFLTGPARVRIREDILGNRKTARYRRFSLSLGPFSTFQYY